MTKRLDALIDRALEPVDGRSLAVFRILFGLVMAVAMARYIANGWVEIQYIEPKFFFKFSGLAWVKVPQATTLYVMAYGLAAGALCIALGLFTRPALILFGLGFGYWESMDVTNYLNHYVLVLLLTVQLLLTPCDRVWSLDNWRKGRGQTPTIPSWCLWMLRYQVAAVYLSAAIAKINTDWLVHGQPMGIWLASRGHLPVIGWLQQFAWTPLLFSWAGFAYDLTIPALLIWRRTRRIAFAAVLVFHGTTHILFNIGVFPFLMTAASTLFFAPSWPKRAGAAEPRPGPQVQRKPWMRRLAYAALFIAALQVAWPQRHILHGGNVLWHEQGMRFSWRVMVREKHGSITYRVEDQKTGRVWQVPPSRYLTMRQEAEFAGQPDLIRKLAQHIHQDFAKRGIEVAVRVDSPVSLNGRAAQLLIDPAVDLVKPLPEGWILKAPSGLPRSSKAGRL